MKTKFSIAAREAMAERLKQAIEQEKLMFKEIAEILGITQQEVSAINSGRLHKAGQKPFYEIQKWTNSGLSLKQYEQWYGSKIVFEDEPENSPEKEQHSFPTECTANTELEYFISPDDKKKAVIEIIIKLEIKTNAKTTTE